MFNSFMLIGIIELVEIMRSKHRAYITLKVPNDKEGYDTIKIELRDFMVEGCADLVRRGNKIGLKGKIEAVNGNTVLVAQKAIYFDMERR